VEKRGVTVVEWFLAAMLVTAFGLGALLTACCASEGTRLRRRAALVAVTALPVGLAIGLWSLAPPFVDSPAPLEVPTAPAHLNPADYPAGALRAGDTLPAFEADGWFNGEPSAVAVAGRRLTVIDIWSFWYGDPRITVTGLIDTYQKYKDRGVAFISVTNMPKEGVQGLVSHFNIPWPCGYEAKPETLAKWGAYNFPNPRRGYEVKPTIYLVGADGRVIWNDGHARMTASLDPRPHLRQLDEKIAEALSISPDGHAKDRER
jgi:hypothetical protein